MSNWDMNRWFGTGRLTRDAELKYTPQGNAVLSFSMAVDGKPNSEGKSKVSFFDFNLWGKGAEAIVQYMTVGKAIIVDGHLEQDRWTNQEQKKMSRVKIIADRVKFQFGTPAPAKGEPAPAEPPHAYDENGYDEPPDMFPPEEPNF